MEEVQAEPESKKTSLKSYTAKVLTESSLSALSNILATRSTRRKTFKSLVFISCLIGFFYQSITFLGYVFEYPTIVDIDITNVETAEMPGITFCNNNGITRSKFCKKYPNLCKKADKDYCNKYPFHCTGNKTLVPKKEYYKMVNNLTLDEYKDLGQDIGNFLIYNDTPLIDSISSIEGPFLRSKTPEGLGRIGCYSLFSLVDSPSFPQQTDESQIIKRPVVTVKFNVEHDESFIPFHQPGVIFSLHSPYMAVNPVENGIFMRPGRVYKILFKMDKEVLLPYPFDTNCHNYTDDWLKRNRTGVRMQEMCRHECAYHTMMNYLNCTMLTVFYPNNGNNAKICTHDDSANDTLEGLMDDEIDECAGECREDCSKVKYSYSSRESYTADTIFDEVSEEERNLIVVEIYFGDSEIVTLKHRPQYLEVEVFSYIGGFIGVWLGISLVEITNFFESLFRIAIFAFRRKNNS